MLYQVIIFFFNDTATTEIYTLSLHDALPIYQHDGGSAQRLRLGSDTRGARSGYGGQARWPGTGDRKSTRLNSSHGYISYAVFCLKKKKNESRPMECHVTHTLVVAEYNTLNTL